MSKSTETTGHMEAGATCHLHAEYARVFDALRAVGVPFCLLRPAEALPALEKDLDLLVAPGRRAVALRALVGAGYLVARGEHLNPGKIALVKWTSDGAAYLDLHLAVVSRGLEYLDADGALARAVEVNGLPQLAPADMAAVLLLHDLLGKGYLQEKYRPAITAGLARWPGSETERDLAGRGLAGLLPRDETTLALLYADRAEATHLAHAVERRILRQPRMRLRRVLLRVRRLFARPAKGVSVCFLGPDGSGKSTTMENFARLVRDELRWPVSTQYLGPWGHHHFPRLVRATSRRVPMTFAEFRARGAALAPLRWLRAHAGYWLGLAVLYFELWWRQLRVWRAKRLGHLVICDRYIYDCLSGEMHGITPRYRGLRSLLCALYPRPDRIYLLHAPPEVLVERKQDLDLPTMKAMQALYGDMAERWRMTRVSTEVPPADVARGILERDFAFLVGKRRT